MREGGSSRQVPDPPLRLRGVEFRLILLASLPFLLFLAIPLIAVLARVSPSQLLRSLFEEHVADAITLSISTTLIATGLTMVFGTPVAYLLARYTFWGRSLVDTLIDLPIVLPPAVAGVALLMAFGRQGIFGPFLQSIGLTIPFTRTAVVFAQLFVASPFYVKSAVQGFMRVDRELEQSAAMDGASAFRIFRDITLPLSLPSLTSGLVMTWARALGEFGGTIIFAGNYPGRTQTMPLAIYLGFEIDFSVAVTLAVVLLSISFAIIFLLRKVLHDRMFVV
ncbi:MAG TPA: ABC transporter permease [Bacteroidota bacterium]|nr:ABC transporter permease [Bacteroidota bacterium]